MKACSRKRRFTREERDTTSKCLSESSDDFAICKHCGKNITTELKRYASCRICGQQILFECEKCHYDIVHFDHVCQEVQIIKVRVDLSEESKSMDMVWDLHRTDGCMRRAIFQNFTRKRSERNTISV